MALSKEEIRQGSTMEVNVDADNNVVGEDYGLYGGLLKAAAGAVETGLNYKDKKDAAEKQAGTDKANATKAIAADEAAWQALTTAANAQPSNRASSQALADQAVMMAQMAGSGLSPTAQAERSAAATARMSKALADANVATKNANDASKDAAKQSIMQYQVGKANAAQKVAMLASGVGAISAKPPTQAEIEMTKRAMETVKGSFFTNKIGPLPFWGWALGLAATGFGAYMIFRKKR
jgi:hypothetical protein